MTPVYFIFSEGRKFSEFGGMRNVFRIARRNPIVLYAWWLARWTQFLTCSRACHVAVSHSEAVLDFTVAGVNYWPWLGYWMKYPGTFAYVRIWTDNPPDLDQFQHLVGQRQRAWKTVLKYFTFDSVRRSSDCADIARHILLQMGIETPRCCRSPGGLLWYLEAHGYETVRFTNAPAPKRRSNDR